MPDIYHCIHEALRWDLALLAEQIGIPNSMLKDDDVLYEATNSFSKKGTLFLYDSVLDSCHLIDGNTTNTENIPVTCILSLFRTSRKFPRAKA